jgi:hypothetical protein
VKALFIFTKMRKKLKKNKFKNALGPGPRVAVPWCPGPGFPSKLKAIVEEST